MTRDEQLIRAALEMAAEVELGFHDGISAEWRPYTEKHVRNSIRSIDPAEVLAKAGEAQQVSDAAKEDGTCTCGAGHGSMEGHTDWCDWTETTPPQEAPHDHT